MLCTSSSHARVSLHALCQENIPSLVQKCTATLTVTRSLHFDDVV